MANTKKKPQKKAQTQSDLDRRWSILLFGIGGLLVLLAFIPGESGWAWIRTNILFGTFGISGWLLGFLVIFWAVWVSLGKPVLGWIIRGVVFILALSGVALVFGSQDFAGLSFIGTLQALHGNGAAGGWGGGLISLVFGWTLLSAFGRVAARALTILILIVAVMFFARVTPGDVAYFLRNLFGLIQDKLEDRRARREAWLEEQQAYEEEYDDEPPFDPEPLPQPTRRRSRSVDVSLGPDALTSVPGKGESDEVHVGPGGTFGMNPLGGNGKGPDIFADEAPLEPYPITRPGPEPFSAAAEDDTIRPFDPYSSQSLFDEEGKGNMLLFGEDDPYAPLGGAESKLPRGTLVDVEYVSPDAPPPSPEFDLFGRSASGEPVQFPYHNPNEDHFANSMKADLQSRIAPLPDAPQPGEAGSAVAPLDKAPQTAEPPSNGMSAPPSSGAGSFGTSLGDFSAPDVPVAPAAVAAAAVTAGSAAPQPAEPQTNLNEALFEGGASPSVEALIDKAAAAKESAAPSTAQLSNELPTQRPYDYPPASLFAKQPAENDTGAKEEMKRTAELLVSTLSSFGVETRILDVCRGPSVTRYEVQPQAGVKISKITNLSDDIALNLAAAGVRIEAPIPGKPAVGIEVPNKIKSTVAIRSILESNAFTGAKSPLSIALGKDIAGECVVADLTKMPHLLIAGSTGSGKSVCINATIMSLLYRSSPEEVQMILIDPKVVELAEYNGIPHLMMPVVTEPKKAAQALGQAVKRMDDRYYLFAEHGVRDIASYNRLAATRPDLDKLPYIAIVIDELADLMMVAGKDVENYICRLAQKARAAGMHLIIATQRPSVDVITGLIKANVPSRIAFAVSSQVDSRTILDGAGAEKLLGMGDMLFMPIGSSKPTRVQGTYVQDKEITAVLDHIKRTSTPSYDEGFLEEMQNIALSGAAGADDAPGEGGDMLGDPVFISAVETALENGQISTSHLQRRLRLGYARAGRIVDEMERLNIISEPNGSKPREVLITRDQWLEMSMNADG